MCLYRAEVPADMPALILPWGWCCCCLFCFTVLCFPLFCFGWMKELIVTVFILVTLSMSYSKLTASKLLRRLGIYMTDVCWKRSICPFILCNRCACLTLCLLEDIHLSCYIMQSLCVSDLDRQLHFPQSGSRGKGQDNNSLRLFFRLKVYDDINVKMELLFVRVVTLCLPPLLHGCASIHCTSIKSPQGGSWGHCSSNNIYKCNLIFV